MRTAKINPSLQYTLVSITLLIIFTILLPETTYAQWSQLGSNIEGEAARDESGSAISLSADGETVAIGAHKNSEFGAGSGHVRIYQLIEGNWIQKGADIDGVNPTDASVGWSVSLSADGERLAIGRPSTTDNGQSAGRTTIFQFVDTTWVQLGGAIEGENKQDNSGWDVSLSDDGSTVAIGETGYDSNGVVSGINFGRVKIFQFVDDVWTQVGADIYGDNEIDVMGFAVSLNADGSTVAVTAINNDDGANNAGQVKVFQLVDGAWTQLGGDLNGDGSGSQFGEDISLSDDGRTVAIGASSYDITAGIQNFGQVRIYQFIDGSWEQKGSSLDGEAGSDRAGGSVSLSADGGTVAFGAEYNDGNGDAAGQARVFRFMDGDWEQQGGDLDGETAGVHAGAAVSLSANGATIAIGSPFTEVRGIDIDAGMVQVLKNPLLSTRNEAVERPAFVALSVYPNPCLGNVNIHLGDLRDVSIKVYNVTGQLLYQQANINTQNHQVELNYAPGVYFIAVELPGGETQHLSLIKQ